ncbi:hypothetical protein F8388_016096 [Cannabis sativa]|uniref:Uncharacterized protein n=1 Tax=Cannabis sativa TaxID=3483 RepID=A0A7J6FV23_CANSA|nr:hypothetical protein F8388_016096 [Cannabis sativa]
MILNLAPTIGISVDGIPKKLTGIPKKLAPTIGISIDHRRRNRSLEDRARKTRLDKRQQCNRSKRVGKLNALLPLSYVKLDSTLMAMTLLHPSFFSPILHE